MYLFWCFKGSTTIFAIFRPVIDSDEGMEVALIFFDILWVDFGTGQTFASRGRRLLCAALCGSVGSL